MQVLESIGRVLQLDPRFVELTRELSQASPLFGGLWARHEVRGQRGGPA